MRITMLLATAFSCLCTTFASAEKARVAVAANFSHAASVLIEQFNAHSDHQLSVSTGSTGQLFAQISQAAPYDVFLAADASRPAAAIQRGFAVEGSQFTYAIGRLVVYSTSRHPQKQWISLLRESSHKIALANPDTAPYGAAALEVIQNLNLYDEVSSRLIFGNNVAQAFQFAYTGNAAFAFVSLSQVLAADEAAQPQGAPGSHWTIALSQHREIRQDAVLLTHGRNNVAAAAFLEFLKSDSARLLIQQHGYAMPGMAHTTE